MIKLYSKINCGLGPGNAIDGCLDVSRPGSFALSPFTTSHWSVRYSVFFAPFCTLSTLVSSLPRCFSLLPAQL